MFNFLDSISDKPNFKKVLKIKKKKKAWNSSLSALNYLQVVLCCYDNCLCLPSA